MADSGPALGPRITRGGGFVYFLQPQAGGLIKVGTATDPKQRVRCIAAMSPLPLKVLRLIYGGAKSEHLIHHYYEDERQHGEWFTPSDRLVRWIAALEDVRLEEGLTRETRRKVCPRCQWHSPLGSMKRTCPECGYWQGLGVESTMMCRLCTDSGISDGLAHVITCGAGLLPPANHRKALSSVLANHNAERMTMGVGSV